MKKLCDFDQYSLFLLMLKVNRINIITQEEMNIFKTIFSYLIILSSSLIMLSKFHGEKLLKLNEGMKGIVFTKSNQLLVDSLGKQTYD